MKAITLTPLDSIALDVEAKQKKGKGKFLLKMSWDISAAQKDTNFTISAQSPRIDKRDKDKTNNSLKKSLL